MISESIARFPIHRMLTIHGHSARLRQYLSYEDRIPISLLEGLLEDIDVIVAPDQGAVAFAQHVSKRYGRLLVTLTKQRLSSDDVKVTLGDGNVQHKRVMIVDDMITSGGTVMRAAEKLYDAGAAEVQVYATHGLFSGPARQRLAHSPITRIHVTNTLPQGTGEKIHVLEITEFLCEILHQENDNRHLA